MAKVVYVKPLPAPTPLPGWLAALFTFAGLALFVWFVIAMLVTLLG